MAPRTRSDIIEAVERYYTSKILSYGPGHQGVDWPSRASQETRFAQLVKLLPQGRSFSLNDYGCGYGALYAYLEGRGTDFVYRGYDVSDAMIRSAERLFGDRPGCVFSSDGTALTAAEYAVASGVLNVKLDVDEASWSEYVLAVVEELDSLSTRGFGFNVLTSYSDPEARRADLYYADPRFLFDHCKRRYSRNVALLHDYGLYEFTILVRK